MTDSLWNIAAQSVAEVESMFPGLENTVELASRVPLLENEFKIVHVVGTPSKFKTMIHCTLHK